MELSYEGVQIECLLGAVTVLIHLALACAKVVERLDGGQRHAIKFSFTQ
jgi:hypothetical protein